MKSIRDQLADAGIRLARWRVGNHKIVCPRCSAGRTRHDFGEWTPVPAGLMRAVLPALAVLCLLGVSDEGEARPAERGAGESSDPVPAFA